MVAHEEILDEFGRVGETLQSRIHEAGVAKVLQAAVATNSATFWHYLVDMRTEELVHGEEP